MLPVLQYLVVRPSSPIQRESNLKLFSLQQRRAFRILLHDSRRSLLKPMGHPKAGGQTVRRRTNDTVNTVKSSKPTIHALCRRIYPAHTCAKPGSFMSFHAKFENDRAKRHMVGIESAPVWLYTAHLDMAHKTWLIRSAKSPSRNSCLKLLSRPILNRNRYTSPNDTPTSPSFQV